MIEASWQDLMDVLWVIEIDRDLAIERLQVRNHLSKEDSQKRVNSQISNEERKQYATAVITNSGDIDVLQNKCNDLWNNLVTSNKFS